MPQNNRRVSMRLRRFITLSVVGILLIGTAGVLGLPKLLSDQVANLPESIQTVADQVQAKPATIFDPPKYSIDEADSIWVVVNKQRQISPLKYQPTNLVFPAFPRPKVQNSFGLQLREEAALATEEMASAMAEEGIGTLILNSGFRTYKNQQGLYNRTRDTRGLAVAEKLSARPGHSEHQLGLAADFSVEGQGCVIMVCFGNTEAGRWLAENAHEYGFILRYPKGYKPITGFQYEPWHFRYVGIELANEMKTKGIKTLEEFWELESAPDYTAPAG
jgi:D-alanyl-D-alanine carboxypeptidase